MVSREGKCYCVYSGQVVKYGRKKQKGGMVPWWLWDQGPRTAKEKGSFMGGNRNGLSEIHMKPTQNKVKHGSNHQQVNFLN